MKLPISPVLATSPAPLSLSAEGRGAAPGKLAGPCQDFEAIFLQSLFKAMRSATIDGGLFEKSNDKEIFQDLMDLEMARAAAAGNTLGIGLALQNQLQGVEAAAESATAGPVVSPLK